jgi:NADPH:quinone reductase-like Zn-dependent oxidoreductase
VLGPIGGDTAGRSLGVLRPGGHMVTAVAEEDEELIARFETAGMRFSGVAVDPDPVALHRLVERGELRVHVQSRPPQRGTAASDRDVRFSRALAAGG